MRLLVSVVDVAEARTLRGSAADVIDVKDPSQGSLGAPAPAVVRGVRAVAGAVPVSVALGDLPHLPRTAALAAAGAAAAGAQYVKVGLRGSGTPAQAVALLSALRDAVDPAVAVIGAAYADAARLDGTPLDPRLLPRAAAQAGISGCLLDTAVKDGRGLLHWLDAALLRELVDEAHAAGMTFAVAGELTLAELPALAATGADFAGLRSAVCAGGRRSGRLDVELVARAAAAAHATPYA